MRHSHLKDCAIRDTSSVHKPATGDTVSSAAARHELDGATRARLEQRFTNEAFPLRAELMRIARRYAASIHDAEDLVQDTFVKAWLSFESCTPGSNLRAWMVRIMVNTWIDNHRKTQRRPREVLAGSVTDAQVSIDRQLRAVVPSAEETALTHLPNHVLQQCIRSLPFALQSALFYADVCQFPVKQIAEIESIPLGTVMSRLHRARSGLRSALAEETTPGLQRQGRSGSGRERTVPACGSRNPIR